MGSAGKGFLYRAAFFIGWLLSPFTFWNDSFINIPIAYLCANLFARFFHVRFLWLVLAFYWLSNALGILIMYLAGRGVLEERKGMIKGIINLLATIIIYSLILLVLDKIGILKPIK